MLAKPKSEKTKGIIALIFVSLMFSSMGIFIRFLQIDFTIVQQVYLRVLLALGLGILFFFSDIHFEKLLKISKREWGLLFLRALSLYVLAVPLVSYAFMSGKYGNISFLQALPFAAVLGFILLKEKVTNKKILYITLAFFGVVLVSVQDVTNLFSWGFAEILSIISCFFFSLGYVLRRWQSNVLSNKEMTLLIFFISAILLMLTSVFLGEGLPQFSGSTSVLLALFGAGIFNIGILVLTNYGFEKVEAVIASNILTLESVFALLIAILLYQEIPSMKELIGGVLIVFSVYQMNKLA